MVGFLRSTPASALIHATPLGALIPQSGLGFSSSESALSSQPTLRGGCGDFLRLLGWRLVCVGSQVCQNFAPRVLLGLFPSRRPCSWRRSGAHPWRRCWSGARTLHSAVLCFVTKNEDCISCRGRPGRRRWFFVFFFSSRETSRSRYRGDYDIYTPTDRSLMEFIWISFGSIWIHLDPYGSYSIGLHMDLKFIWISFGSIWISFGSIWIHKDPTL